MHIVQVLHPIVGSLMLTAMAFALSGCKEKPNMMPVKGTVLLDGQPLPRGTILTMPNSGRGANGVIDANGAFELTTITKGDGAKLGRHKVAVVAYEKNAVGPEDGLGKLLVPQEYTNPETSGLTIDVTDGENAPVLQLKSK